MAFGGFINGKAAASIVSLVMARVNKPDHSQTVEILKRQLEEHKVRMAQSGIDWQGGSVSTPEPLNITTGVQPTTTYPTAESLDGSKSVTDKETLGYQLAHLIDEMSQLETHLSEGCVIAGKRCSCCLKHSQKADLFARETIPIASRAGVDLKIFNAISQWASQVANTSPSVENEVFQRESGQASIFRKQLEGISRSLQ